MTCIIPCKMIHVMFVLGSNVKISLLDLILLFGGVLAYAYASCLVRDFFLTLLSLHLKISIIINRLFGYLFKSKQENAAV